MDTSKDRFREMFTRRVISQSRWREAIHGLTYNEAKSEFAAAVERIARSGGEDQFFHYLWGYVKIISDHTKFAFGWSPTLYHHDITAEKDVFRDRCAERFFDRGDFIEWAWHLLVMAYAIIDRSASSMDETWND